VPKQRVPVEWSFAFRVQDVDLVKVALDLLHVLDWNRVDAFESRKVLKNDCHVKVLDAVKHTLENNDFNVIHIHYEERELAYCNQAVFGRSDLYNLLLGAAKERKIVEGDVYHEFLPVLVCSLFDQLAEGLELGVKALALLSFLLLLFELVHVVQFAGTLEVDVLRGDT
jgi:hypothetical protein